MADRMTRYETWSYLERVLESGEVAEKGHIACGDTSNGHLVAGQASTTVIPLGYFEDSFTGNGTRKARVRLFREVVLHRFDNDGAPNAVDDADFLSPCYLKDSKTVSALDTSRSIAGRVWAVTSAGVLIEPALSIGVQGPQGEPGE